MASKSLVDRKTEEREICHGGVTHVLSKMRRL